MKSIQKILTQKDLLLRFRLLQLFVVDIFTKSITSNVVEPLIVEYLDKDDVQQTPEHILHIV